LAQNWTRIAVKGVESWLPMWNSGEPSKKGRGGRKPACR